MTKRQQYLSNVRIPYDKLREAVEMYDGSGNRDLTFVNAYLVAIISAMVAFIKSEEGAIRQILDKNYLKILEWFGGKILLAGINYDENTKKHTYRFSELYKES